MVKKMTIEEFVNFMANIKGCQFVNVVACADAKMNKRNNPYYGRVQIVSESQKQVNYSYENAVNNRLDKQGIETDFVADSLPWGVWKYANKIIEHNGEVYLRTYSVKGGNYKKHYLLDGKIATDDEVNNFMPYIKVQSSVSTKQSEHGLDTEYQVKPQNYNIKNIIEISINNMKITIEK